MDSISVKEKQTLSPQRQGVLYALPVLATSFLASAVAVLQGIYAKDFGLALTSIAMVLLVSRFFDAVTDPLIGYFSDWHKARDGSRKPFIVVGSVLFIVSGYFLYVPPENVTISYFLCWYLAFFFGMTLFEIPHVTWASDLAKTSQEKTTFYSWRALMSSVGLMSFFILPLLPVFETSAITPETLRWSAIVAGCLLAVLLIICITKLPSSNNESESSSRSSIILQKESASQLWRSIRKNTSLLLFFSSFICYGFGAGMCMTLLFLFIDSYLGLGAVFALLYVISHIFSISSVGLWALLANRWSKQTVWVIATGLLVTGMFGTGFLSPGYTNQVSLLLCLTLIYCGFAAIMVVAPSLLSDIIDYSTWKFKRDRGATFFSLFTLVNKTNVAIGGAVGMALAGWYGFDASATLHNPDSAFGLRLGIAWLPIPFLLLSLVFILRIPINPRRHAIIQRCLERQLNRTIKQQQKHNHHVGIVSIHQTDTHLTPST